MLFSTSKLNWQFVQKTVFTVKISCNKPLHLIWKEIYIGYIGLETKFLLAHLYFYQHRLLDWSQIRRLQTIYKRNCPAGIICFKSHFPVHVQGHVLLIKSIPGFVIHATKYRIIRKKSVFSDKSILTNALMKLNRELHFILHEVSY